MIDDQKLGVKELDSVVIRLHLKEGSIEGG